MADERAAFGRRLHGSLKNAACATGATEFTREFNARSGMSAITVYCARKWLRGEAIPSQTAVRAIAAWLGVSVQWLRFGEAAEGHGDSPGAAVAHSTLHFDLARLDQQSRILVTQFVALLLKKRR